MDFFTEQVIAWLAALGLEKEALKAGFYDNGLGPLWDLLRDTYFNPKVILLAIPLWLFLGWLWAAEKPGPNAKASLSLDFVYPLFCLPVQATIVVWLIATIKRFFETTLPFLDTGLLDDQPLWLQATGAFLITDFMFYITHRLKHKVKWFWHFHAIHHSQRYLSPLTTHRNHPGELIINALVGTVPIAIIGGSYPAWAFFALVNGMWGYYIHSSMRMSLGPLNYLIVTPQNHRFHHTINAHEIDKNFGERLAIWDWMFGTLHKDFHAYPATGIPGCDWIEEKGAGPLALARTFCRQLVYPFRAIALDIARAIASTRRASAQR